MERMWNGSNLFKFFCLLICLILLGGCGGSQAAVPSGSDAETNEPNDGEPVNLLFAHGYPLDSGKGPAFQWIIEELDTISNGNLVVTQKGNGSICDDTTSLDAVLAGVTDFGHSVVSYDTGVVQEVGSLAIPGYFAGDKETWLKFAADLQEPLEAAYKKYGLQYLCADFSSMGALFGNGKQITSPDDCKGLLIRSSGTFLTKTLESWGASATVLGIGDLATALERGTVDYAYSGYPIVRELSMYELVDYVTYTPLTETFSCITMNMDKWNSLSSQQQTWIKDVCARFPEKVWDMLNVNYEPYKDFVEDSGCSVVELTSEQAQEFTKLCEPLFEEIKPTSSPEGLEILKVIYKYNGWAWAD